MQVPDFNGASSGLKDKMKMGIGFSVNIQYLFSRFFNTFKLDKVLFLPSIRGSMEPPLKKTTFPEILYIFTTYIHTLITTKFQKKINGKVLKWRPKTNFCFPNKSRDQNLKKKKALSQMNFSMRFY